MYGVLSDIFVDNTTQFASNSTVAAADAFLKKTGGHSYTVYYLLPA